ncbi:MAG: YdeI/OmpD-associated family protein [Actinomycetota bacterium]|nr:YdeI/OmpD-associated family protein [Actinomycetota bacterium]
MSVDELVVADARVWRRWLKAHGSKDRVAWLVLAKKGVTQPTKLTYAEALEEALCYGWIDGQKASRDASTFKQRFTPRRVHSQWSQRNIELVGRLIAEGRMTPQGLLMIEQAKADGRWDRAYAGQASMELPADFAMALDRCPKATAMFEILTKQNRYAILLRIDSAKREETRIRRLEQFIAMLERGETIYPQKRQLSE